MRRRSRSGGRQPSSSEATSERREPTPMSVSPMARILVVEDNELNSDMLSRRLVRSGHEVRVVVDGAEALDAIQAERPDLVLMDIGLPVMDGWETTRRLRAMPGMATLPVVALTAHAMQGEREKAIAAGCDDYETKPVDMKSLLGKIGALLARSD